MEIASRSTGISPAQVGTLHSLCFRAAGDTGSPVLDSPKGIAKWNEWIAPKRSAWKLSGASEKSADDPLADHGEETEGDELLSRMNILRHRRSAAEISLDPDPAWPPSVRGFWAAWFKCMEELGGLDFTLMLEQAAVTMDEAPGRPRILLVDEAQDLSRLEASILRKWGRAAEQFILVGDPDQALYTWRGADPRIFLDTPVPEERRRVLAQSYRVPGAVHKLAQRIIRQVHGRADVAYDPTGEAGAVSFDPAARWRYPEGWLADVLSKLPEESMILAPCGYHLLPLLGELRERGIPFHNPYRLRQGAWNPLGQDRTGKTAGSQLLAFLRGDIYGWDTSDLQAWVPLLRSTSDGDRPPVLAHGAKTQLGKLSGPRPSAPEYLALFRRPEDATKALDRDVAWLMDHVSAKDRKRLMYVHAVYRRGGSDALRAKPKLVVGTIHSVKGGEANHVYVLTSLPSKWAEAPNAPELHRLFYVAVTRARQSVTILNGDRGGYRT